MNICYQYDSEGYYVGVSNAYNNLLPNNSTLIEPTLVEGFIPKWCDDAWVQVENHKGEKGYVNNVDYEIEGYGPYPDGWSTTPPELTAEALASTRAQEISAELTAIDRASIRSLRAIAENKSTPEDHQHLINLEAQAEALRTEQQLLKG